MSETIQVSMVADAHATETKPVQLLTLLREIKDGRWLARQEEIRAKREKKLRETNGDLKAAKAEIKKSKESLPAVTYAGLFSYRSNENWTVPSGILAADLDKLDSNLTAVREKLRQSPHLVFDFESVTGSGLRAGFRIPIGTKPDEDRYHACFEAVRQHVLDICGVEIDPSGKDPVRLSFVCADRNARLNLEATPIALLPAQQQQKKAASITNKAREPLTKEQVRDMLRCIPKRPGYGDWIKVVAAVGDALDIPDAVEVLDEWSKEEERGEYSKKLQSGFEKIHAGTLVRLARQHGWTAPGEIKNLDAYLENDGGNAEMFVDRYSEIVRYSHAHESWFIWDGNRWLPDAREKVHQLALGLSKKLASDLLSTPGRPDPQKIKRAILMGSQNKISAALWLARSDSRIVIRREQIDVDNFLLGAPNGVIDLQTGQRRDGQKGDFITKSCGCNYDPAAQAPRWTAFLAEVFPDQTALIDYIQRAAGYSITGDTREQCIFFLYGTGANGKSTFIEVLVKLLGNYATTASQNVLCDNRYGREPLDEIASLEGARLVSIAETGAEHMAEVRIKLLTGGDTVTGKAHYKAPTNFQPKFKLWIFGNSKPAIYGVDYAIWRRIKLIPFTVQFPPEKQDSTLKEKLLAELPGILNWAIQGALAWQNKGRLEPPECVVKATEAYREESDILKEFIDENVVREENAQVSHKDLFKRYKNWSEQRSEKPFSGKKLARLLRERSYNDNRDWSGLRWLQIKLSDET